MEKSDVHAFTSFLVTSLEETSIAHQEGIIGQAIVEAGNYYVEYTVEDIRHMETVQIVLDKKLLQATDRAARRLKRNRSALVREALREHLRRLEVRTREERDREGYSRQPQMPSEARLWEAEAAWPAE
jgi:predicted transcriptional regulator